MEWSERDYGKGEAIGGEWSWGKVMLVMEEMKEEG